MKVLQTGGAGFIGSNIADAYLEDAGRSIDRPLDDESWKALVKTGPVPPPPGFTRSSLALVPTATGATSPTR